MGPQQSSQISTSQTNQNNSLNHVTTQQDINKNSMNVIKGYRVKEAQPMPRTTTIINQKPKFKYNISLQNLRNTFIMFAIDGNYLNKEAFNNSIENLFRFPTFPEMHFTYLSEKIYELLDDSGDGKIQEDEFTQGFKNVLSNKDFRIRCMCIIYLMLIIVTMMAMMNLPNKTRNYIEPNEIKDYFFKSWVHGYKYLGFQIETDRSDFQSRKLPVANSKQLEMWALRFEMQIKLAIEADLRENGIDPNRNIEYEQFKKWVYLDHTLYINYGFKTVMKATTLAKLDEVGFDDSPIQRSLNNNNNLNNYYPSF